MSHGELSLNYCKPRTELESKRENQSDTKNISFSEQNRVKTMQTYKTPRDDLDPNIS